jgi:hypothetical protein
MICFWARSLRRMNRCLMVKLSQGRWSCHSSGGGSSHISTASARVQCKFKLCGICGGQSGTGAVLFRALQFSLQFSFYRIIHTHLSSGACTIGQLVADVTSGLSITLSHETIKIKVTVEAMRYQNRCRIWNVWFDDGFTNVKD